MSLKEEFLQINHYRILSFDEKWQNDEPESVIGMLLSDLKLLFEGLESLLPVVKDEKSPCLEVQELILAIQTNFQAQSHILSHKTLTPIFLPSEHVVGFETDNLGKVN